DRHVIRRHDRRTRDVGAGTPSNVRQTPSYFFPDKGDEIVVIQLVQQCERIPASNNYRRCFLKCTIIIRLLVETVNGIPPLCKHASDRIRVFLVRKRYRGKGYEQQVALFITEHVPDVSFRPGQKGRSREGRIAE